MDRQEVVRLGTARQVSRFVSSGESARHVSRFGLWRQDMTRNVSRIELIRLGMSLALS